MKRKSVGVINKILDISYPHKKSRPYFFPVMAALRLAGILFHITQMKESEVWLTKFYQELKKGVTAAHIEFGDFPFKENNVLWKN